MLKIITTLLALLSTFSVYADSALDKLYSLGGNTREVLPFTASCSLNNDFVQCNVFMQPGAYVYKDSLKMSVENGVISTEKLPDGTPHEDLNGQSEIFMDSISVKGELLKVKKEDTLQFFYRGCDSKGICYPTKTVELSINHDVNRNVDKLPSSDISQEAGIFKDYDNFLIILLLCLVFGVALDLTPCVLPLLSIYSATIMGSNYVSAAHKIKQNISYILGLALTYCILGLVFSEIGVSAHGFLQHPVSIVIMSAILLVFTLDCAGIINLKVPLLFNNSLQIAINRQKDGTLAKAFIFGALSALITTPCTSAPLAGALVYIITSNSILKGVLMFLFIGLGMGMPLLVIGIFGAKYLSKLKNHSEQIRKLFAIPLLLGAYYICRHLFGEMNEYIEPAVYALCGAYFIGVMLKNRKVSLILMTAFFSFWAIYAAVYTTQSKVASKNFIRLHKLEDLNSYRGKTSFVTFSAEWCSNCHELDKTIYASDEFENMTRDINRLRFDLTDPSSQENQKLTEHFNIIGVPFLIVLDEDGQVITRYTGSPSEQELKKLLGH